MAVESILRAFRQAIEQLLAQTQASVALMNVLRAIVLRIAVCRWATQMAVALVRTCVTQYRIPGS